MDRSTGWSPQQRKQENQNAARGRGESISSGGDSEAVSHLRGALGSPQQRAAGAAWPGLSTVSCWTIFGICPPSLFVFHLTTWGPLRYCFPWQEACFLTFLSLHSFLNNPVTICHCCVLFKGIEIIFPVFWFLIILCSLELVLQFYYFHIYMVINYSVQWEDEIANS